MPYKDPAVAAQRTRERLKKLRAENPGYSTKKNRKWNQANPEKRRAHKVVERALTKRELIRGVCEVCGSDKSEAHHDDYAKPLVVRWVCRAHHSVLDMLSFRN